MVKRGLVLLALLFVCTAARAQGTQDAPNKDACLEKELSDVTRLIFADNDRMKVGILTEQFMWADDYHRAAAEVLKNQFSSNFVDAGGQTFGTLMLYIFGTKAQANGAQYVSIRLQIFSSELLLPENGDGFSDLHTAKISDPVRNVSGLLVFSEEGVLLPPLEQGGSFELWQALRLQTIRETTAKVLSDFVAKWEKAKK
jgi:hypothetical protein